MGEMNLVSIVLVVVIAAIAVYALRRIVGIWRGSTDCCGDGGGRKAAKRVRVEDTDESHYPYAQDLKVGGMTCDACVRNVENALNGLGGTWARVSLADKTAHVLSKEPLDKEAAKSALVDAGYYLMRG